METGFRSSKGNTIRAYCHLVCTGKAVALAWLKKSTSKKSLDTNGRLMVDGYLRVKDQHNIFAIGDITDIRVSFYFLILSNWHLDRVQHFKKDFGLYLFT